MKNKGIDNTKLGLFVIAGLLFLVLTLYMIGRNRNILGSTFSIKAVVSDVNGLVPGNNVRFRGIDVGTVKSIRIVNDTAIHVTLIIDDKMKPYIKKNAIATIGTDGLMGNKLLNINSPAASSELVDEGDTIYSLAPVETDEMLRTLNTTNENIRRITGNLYEISVKLNRSNSLWTLLSDTVIATDFKKAIAALEKTASNTAELTASGKNLVKMAESGNGLVYTLFTDSTLSRRLAASVGQLEHASREVASVAEDVHYVTSGLKTGEGAVDMIMTDSLFRESLLKSALNVEEGTGRFNENMEALKSNFLFRRYFKKLEKQKAEQSGSKE